MPSSFLRVKLPDARRPETKHACPSCCSGPGCCLPFLMPSEPDTKLRFSVIQQPILPVTASHLAKDFMISQNVAQKLRFLRCAHAVNNMLMVIFPAPKIHRVAKRIEVFENPPVIFDAKRRASRYGKSAFKRNYELYERKTRLVDGIYRTIFIISCSHICASAVTQRVSKKAFAKSSSDRLFRYSSSTHSASDIFTG